MCFFWPIDNNPGRQAGWESRSLQCLSDEKSVWKGHLVSDTLILVKIVHEKSGLPGLLRVQHVTKRCHSLGQMIGQCSPLVAFLELRMISNDS